MAVEEATKAIAASAEIGRSHAGLGVFERYLSIWVALCIIAGIALGHWFPALFQAIGRAEFAQVNLPVAMLIWLMSTLGIDRCV